MKPKKILNLYAGIGGNRKKWGDDYEITAIELDETTANVYRDYFPNDIVIITDAHKYLLEHYREYDIIWSSPPCPTHSILNHTKNGRGDVEMEYPDMRLYQEIIFLNNWFKGKWVVENVVPYYTPLIAAKKVDRHLWWSNFNITSRDIKRPFEMATATVKQYEDFLGYDLSKYKLSNKIKNLRNCVIPDTGLHILNCALGKINQEDITQGTLFNQ